jgi:hypothetical protein
MFWIRVSINNLKLQDLAHEITGNSEKSSSLVFNEFGDDPNFLT